MLEDIMSRSTELFGGFLPNLIGALGILVIGWIVALVASAIVRGALKRTTLDNRLAELATGASPFRSSATSGRPSTGSSCCSSS